jgi:XTP/dITP diphosphohydrolase
LFLRFHLVPQLLLLATGNKHKAAEMEAILRRLLPEVPFEIVTAAEFPQIPEPEETGTTFIENAVQKARYYAKASGMLALADDSGLVVDALEGRPGIFSARYASTPQGRIDRVLTELRQALEADANQSTGEHGRRARFICGAALADPSGEAVAEEGRTEGWITFHPRGDQGFGYDPIFVPWAEFSSTEWIDRKARTLAQFSADEKNHISHRARALHEIAASLRERLRTL